MRHSIYVLLAVGVLLATAATTAAQTYHQRVRPRPYCEMQRPSYSKDNSFTLGVGLAVHNDNIGWTISNSYNLGLGVLGVDVIYPFSPDKEEGASVFSRAGLKFDTGLVTIEPDLVASFEERDYRFGVGLGSEYFIGGSFALFLRGFLTYALHPQENGVTWDNMKIAVLAGIVVNI